VVRVLAVLPKRFERYGLALHPDKTRLVAFGPPPPGPNDRKPPQGGHPTFDFLGFTHYWGRTRKGGWAVKRKTASDRLSRFLVRLSRWCRTCRQEPVRWQQEQAAPEIALGYPTTPADACSACSSLEGGSE
jgi:hypothetical protein